MRRRSSERAHYRSRSRSLERKQFSFKLLIDKELSADLTRFSFLQQTAKDNKCEEISVENEGSNQVLLIRSSDFNAKTDAFYAIVSYYFRLLRSNEHTSVVIFIPEGTVPKVIGQKGRQINQFKEESGAIIVIQPQDGHSSRGV